MRAIKNTVYLAFGSSSNKLFLFDYIGLNSQYITTTFSELHQIDILMDKYIVFNYHVPIISALEVIKVPQIEFHNCLSLDTVPVLKCQSCLPGYELDNLTGFCKCPSSMFKGKYQFQCSGCDVSCFDCSDGLQTSCTACRDGSFLVNSTCITCPEGQIFQNNQCVDECQDSFYIQDGECLPCPPNCSQCLLNQTTSVLTCLSCTQEERDLNDECHCDLEKGFLSPEEDTGDCVSIAADDPKYRTIEVLDQLYQSSTQTLRVTFNRPITLTHLHRMRFFLGDGSTERRVFPSKITVDTERNIIILQFDFDETLSNSKLRVTTNEPSLIESKDNSTSFTRYPIVETVSHLDSNNDKEIRTVLKFFRWVVLVAVAVGLPFLTHGVIKMIQLLQVLEYFALINVKVPSNVEIFLEYFRAQDILSYLPNLFYSRQAKKACRLQLKLIVNGLECLTVNNIGHLILPLLLVVFTKIIFSIVSSLLIQFCPRTPHPLVSIVRKVFMWLNNKLSIGVIINILLAIQPDIFLGIYPIFNNKADTSKLDSKSIFLFILMNILYIGTTLYLFFYGFTLKPEGLLKTIKSKISCIYFNRETSFEQAFPDLNLKRPHGILYLINSCIIHTIIPFNLIVFLETPLMQIIPFFCLIVWTLACTLSFNPFKNTLSRINEVITSILFLIALMGFLILYIKGPELTAHSKYYYLGILIIVSLFLINIIYLIVYFIDNIKEIFSLFKTIKRILFGVKEKNNKISKIKPIKYKNSKQNKFKKIRSFKRGFLPFRETVTKSKTLQKIQATPRLKRRFVKKKKGIYFLQFYGKIKKDNINNKI